MPQFCLACCLLFEQVRSGCGSSAARSAPSRCPAAPRVAGSPRLRSVHTLPRALLRIPPSAACAIGKQLFSTSFPQLKGRKNKKLPQLVKIFLDTQLPP